MTSFLGVTPPVSLAGPSEKDLQLTAELIAFLEAEAPSASPAQVEAREEVLRLLNKVALNWIRDAGISAGLSASEAEAAGVCIVTFGSHRLGVISGSSDIDAVCIAPSFATADSFFDILTCALLDTGLVKDLVAVREAYTPLITMTVMEIPVDLLFASVALSQVPGNLEELLTTQDSLLCQMDEKSARAINGPRVAARMLSLVPDIGNFQVTLRFIKLWAERRGLYSNVLGFFGGITWAILTARVCQLFPNMSPAQLVLRFFKVWTKWDWPNAVCLCETEMKDEVSYAHFKVWSKQSAEGSKHLMPILTPAFPSMNSTHNVTATTKRIILAEVNRAFTLLSGPGNFSEVAEAARMEEEQFLMVSVEGKTDLISQKIWGFVESRLRLLISSMEKTAIQLRPYPAKDRGTFFVGLEIPNEAERKSLKPENWDLRPAVSQFIERLADWQDAKKYADSYDVKVTHVTKKDRETAKKRRLG